MSEKERENEGACMAPFWEPPGYMAGWDAEPEGNEEDRLERATCIMSA